MTNKLSTSLALLLTGLLTAPAARANPWYITGTGSWNQSQGSSPTQLLPWGSNYCYLTRVSGRYAGAGEHVQVFTDSSGFWNVGGGSQQHDVPASANCFTYTD